MGRNADLDLTEARSTGVLTVRLAAEVDDGGGELALATGRSQRSRRPLPRQRGPGRPQPRRVRRPLLDPSGARRRADGRVCSTVGGDDGDDTGEQGRADHHRPARRGSARPARAARPRRSPSATGPRHRYWLEDDVQRPGKRSRARLPPIAQATPATSSPPQELAIEPRGRRCRRRGRAGRRSFRTARLRGGSRDVHHRTRQADLSRRRSSARPACCPASGRAHSAGCGRRSGGCTGRAGRSTSS